MNDCGCKKAPKPIGDVHADAKAAFADKARAFLEGVSDLEEGDRRDAIDAEINRYSEHRYLFVAGEALEILRAAR